MSTRRVARGSTPPSTIIYTRRYHHNRFLASSRIISPDIIKKTSPPANYRQSTLVSIRRSAREQTLDDRLNVLKRLEEYREVVNQILYKISKLETYLDISSTSKLFSTSYRRRYARYIINLKSEFEAGNNMISFIYYKRGNKFFLSLYTRYYTINVKYFKKIFFEIFIFEHLIKLA